VPRLTWPLTQCFLSKRPLAFLLELGQFFSRDLRCEWKVIAVELHQRLTLSAQNEAKELGHLRIERTAGRAVDAKPDRAREWISAVGDVLRRWHDKRAALVEANGDELHPGIPIARSRKRNAIFVVGQGIRSALPRFNVLGARYGKISLAEDEAVSTGGIVLSASGSLTNVVVSGNIVKNSPMSGIRVGLIAGSPLINGTVQLARVVDNTIVDAGNNGGAASQAIYQHAVGVFGNVTEVDVARNMIYDTTNPNTGLVNGLYSLYVKQASSPSTTTIRTSQNTVRVNSSDPTVQLRSSFPAPNAGIVDATNANNVLVSSIPGGTGGTTPSLNVDFISFTRYIATITGNSTSQLTLNVPSPPGDTSNPPSYVQWTVGQLVTFRFSCSNFNPTGGCLVTFDPGYAGLCETTTCGTNPVTSIAITSSMGRAITFEVESFSGTGHRFFELYRSPQGVPN